MLGILPENFFPVDIDISFSSKSNEQAAMGDGSNKKSITDTPFTELIIIYKDNRYYDMLCYAELVLAMLSSYYYAYVAAFIKMEYGDSKFYWMMFYETFFLIATCLKFLRSYIPDG